MHLYSPEVDSFLSVMRLFVRRICVLPKKLAVCLVIALTPSVLFSCCIICTNSILFLFQSWN